MEELNLLARSVWKRLARGEAYRVAPAPKPKPAQNDLRPLLLLLVLVLAMNR